MTGTMIGLFLTFVGWGPGSAGGAAATSSAPPPRAPVSVAAAEPTLIDWKMLNGLNAKTGAMTAALKALDGKSVKIAAFIVPLEDNLQEADEFLLVPYFGACIHTPPPPPNQMVYVKMPAHKPIKIGWWEPVMFEGVLHLTNVDSPFGAVSYQMEGVASAPYKPKSP